MIEQVLYLEPDDNAITLSDQIRRAQGERVIVVVPPDCTFVRRRLDLQLVVRQARQRKIDLALVTVDPEIKEYAHDLDVPVFSSLRRAQGRRWRWPWEGVPGKPVRLRHNFLNEYDMQAMRRRRNRRLRFRWVLRALALLLFVAVLGVVGSAAYVMAPAARVTIVPVSEQVQVVIPVVAVPGLESVDFPTRQVPARNARVTVEGSASISTSGARDIPDKAATGSVMFTNLLPQEVAVPQGTAARTTSGTPVRFVTTQAVTVPPNGQATAPVRAVDPGPAGNVDEGLINRVEGAAGLALRCINLAPTDGGSARQVGAATQADRDTLKAILLKDLQRQAMVDMTASAKDSEFVAADSLRVLAIQDETYDHFVGEEANTLNMDMRVIVEGIVVDEQAAHSLVYDALVRKSGPQYELIPSSLRFRRGEVTAVDSRGAVTFYMQGWGGRTARLNVQGLNQALHGLSIDDARAYLRSNLSLDRPPEIQVWPEGFERMPYMAFRIQTDVIVEPGTD